MGKIVSKRMESKKLFKLVLLTAGCFLLKQLVHSGKYLEKLSE